MKSYFQQYKIKTIVDACFELVKQGKVGYLEFSKMSLNEMAKRVDDEISKEDTVQESRGDKYDKV